MPSASRLDIGPLAVRNSSPATRELYNALRRTPFRSQNLSASFESLLEADIPSPSLDHDPDIERLMSSGGPSRQSRRDIVSSTSTFRASSPSSCLQADRDSAGSVYYDYCHDLADEYDSGLPHQPYLPYQSPQPDQRSHIQSLRPASVLPAAQSEYHQSWHTDEPNFYSAALHPPSSSSNLSTLWKPVRTRSFRSANRSNKLQRNSSFAKRSVTPIAVQILCDELDSGVVGYEASRRSSENRPSSPASSLLPSLSFSSTDTSPFSIMTHESTQNMSQTYGIVEHVEPPREKRLARPKRLALGHIQPRNISSPIPSPTFLDVHGARAASYPRLAPSPAPVNAVEVSMFDDSDEEEGKFSHHVKKIKSAVSLQNLHPRSRFRADSSSRNQPPMPALSLGAEWANDGIVQPGSNGSIRPCHSKESNKLTRPTLAANPCEAQSTSPVARLQKKISVRRMRSNTASSTSSAPSPPPNTPILPTSKSTSDRTQSRTSWYQCFSRAKPLKNPDFVITKQKQRNSKASTKSIDKSSSGKVRVFFKKVFRLRK